MLGIVMNSADQVRFFLSSFAMYVPTLVVCLLALTVVVTKWKQAPEAAMWASLGFGLALLLCVIAPLGHLLIQNWISESQGRGNLVWAFTVFGIVNVILHAGVYLLLLVAIFAGRESPAVFEMNPIVQKTPSDKNSSPKGT